MRKSVLVPVVGLLVGASSAFWLVTAADPATTVRASIGRDLNLAKDSDLLSGFVPVRTTIADLFQHHMIEQTESASLVSSIASAMDARNTFERPDAVRPAAFTARRKGEELVFELPPMSVVVATLSD